MRSRAPDTSLCRRAFLRSRTHQAVGSTQLAVSSTHDHAWRALSCGIAVDVGSLTPFDLIKAMITGFARIDESLCRRVSAAMALRTLFGGSCGPSISRPSSLGQFCRTADSGGALRD